MPEVAEPEPEVPGGNDSSLLEINIVEQIEVSIVQYISNVW